MEQEKIKKLPHFDFSEIKIQDLSAILGGDGYTDSNGVTVCRGNDTDSKRRDKDGPDIDQPSVELEK